MKIGVRIHDYGCMPARQLAEALHAHGIQAGQLAIPKAIPGVGSYAEVTDTLLDEIRRAFGSRQIEISVLGCYVEPSLPDAAARMEQLGIFREGIRCAAHLHAGCIATETTPYSGSAAGRMQRFDCLCRSVEWMLREAEKRRVLVAIEPVRLHTLNTPELTAKLLERFRGGKLAVIFDPVNLLFRETVATQSAFWQECLEAFGPSIAACHIKDVRFDGETQVPCPLGHGVMEYAYIAQWLKEHKPEMPLLREEIAPATAQADLRYMRECFL